MFSTSGNTPWQSNGGFSHPQPHAAYIPVPTRNPYGSSLPPPPPPTFIPQPLNHPAHLPPPPPPAMATQNQTAEQRKKVEWPPAVRDYVNRSFAAESELPGVAKHEMEKRLREVITNAAQSNMLNAYNWETMPTPQQMVLEDRKRAALGSFMSNSPGFLPPPPPLPFMIGSNQYPGAPGTEVLRKRKSSEMNVDTENRSGTQPPWKVKKGGALEDRMSAPDKRPKFDNSPISSKSKDLETRRRRFDNKSGSASPLKASAPTIPSEPLGPVVGRSQNLEKKYFRLTSAPNPDDVRPLPILRQTLELLKKKWRDESNYGWACDQFKSLRQDLTVQHIKNDFTTSVYEIHARIALEKGDLGEYNQCQSQLKALYRQNLGGHPIEFKAYRILYYIYTNNKTDMNDVLSELTTTEKREPPIKHALAVRSALALGNHHRFFQLSLDVPNMGAYLVDMFVERERLSALSRISKV